MSIHDRGFHHMPVEQRKAIASKGGKAAHAQGKAHEWTAITASAAAQRSVAARKAKAAQATDAAGQ